MSIRCVRRAAILLFAALVVAQAATAEDKPAGEREQAESSGEARGKWIGLSCRPVEGALRAQLNLPENQGLIVDLVAPDSPAAKAGIQRFDVLMAANDKPLENPRSLVEVVSNASGELAIRLIRGGKEQTVQVLPAERPEDAARPSATDDQPEGGPQTFTWPRRPGVRVDEKDIERWLREKLPEHLPDHLRLRILHDGMAPPRGHGFAAALPEGLTVTVVRTGKEPAKITVKKGDETWEITEDQLDKLPADVRKHVAPLLAPPPFTIPFDGRGVGPAPRPGDFRIRVPGPPNFPQDFDKRFEELNRKMDEMRREMEKRIEELRAQPAPANTT